MATATELWQYRGLIGTLTQRELKTRYKRSFLGWAWSLINPASTLLIYSVVFSLIFRIEPPVAGNGELKNFAVYLFAALVIWNFWNGVVTGSMGALLGAGPLIKKVYFPPECPAIANTLAAMTQTGIEAVFLCAVMIVVGNVSWTFLLLPYVLFLLLLFSLGVGLVLSLLNVYYRDVNYLTSIAMNLLFYGTPIIYPLTLVEDNAPAWILTVVRLNPLTQFVEMARNLTYELTMPSALRLVSLTLVSVLTLVVGSWIFTRKSGDVSEEL